MAKLALSKAKGSGGSKSQAKAARKGKKRGGKARGKPSQVYSTPTPF